MSPDSFWNSRVLLEQEVSGGGRCYYCPNGPSLDCRVEVSRVTSSRVERYFFHTDCLLDLLNEGR